MNKNTIGNVRAIEFPYTYTNVAGEKVTENVQLKVRLVAPSPQLLEKGSNDGGMALATYLSNMIVKWDITDDDEPVEPTPEVILTLPIDFITEMTTAISEAMRTDAIPLKLNDWPDLLDRGDI